MALWKLGAAFAAMASLGACDPSWQRAFSEAVNSPSVQKTLSTPYVVAPTYGTYGSPAYPAPVYTGPPRRIIVDESDEPSVVRKRAAPSEFEQECGPTACTR